MEPKSKKTFLERIKPHQRHLRFAWKRGGLKGAWRSLYWKAVVKYNYRRKKEKAVYGIIDHKYKFIYFRVPKTAHLSIMQALAESAGMPGPQPNSWRRGGFVILGSRRDFPGYFKFCFVRNPYHRLVSNYHMCILQGENRSISTYVGGVIEGLSKDKNFFGGMSFKEFAFAVVNVPDERVNWHLQPQHNLVTDNEGNLMVDFVGKFETLDEDFSKICSKLGLPHKGLAVVNARSYPDYRTYYTEEIKKIVYERYRKDFELFNYDF